MPITANSINRTAKAKKHLLKVKLDKKSLFVDFGLLGFAVFALEPAELMVFLGLEPSGLLVLVEVLESGTLGLDTGLSSELIGTRNWNNNDYCHYVVQTHILDRI